MAILLHFYWTTKNECTLLTSVLFLHLFLACQRWAMSVFTVLSISCLVFSVVICILGVKETFLKSEENERRLLVDVLATLTPAGKERK